MIDIRLKILNENWRTFVVIRLITKGSGIYKTYQCHGKQMNISVHQIWNVRWSWRLAVNELRSVCLSERTKKNIH